MVKLSNVRYFLSGSLRSNFKNFDIVVCAFHFYASIDGVRVGSVLQICTRCLRQWVCLVRWFAHLVFFSKQRFALRMCFCASAAFQNLLFSLLAWFQIFFMFYHEFFEWLFDVVWCIRTSVCSCFGRQQIFAFWFIQFKFRSFLRFRYLRLTRLEWTCQPRTRSCARWSIPLPAAEAALLKRLHPWIRSSFLASVNTRQSHSIFLSEQLELSRVRILSDLIILKWIKKMLGVWPSLINTGAISRRSVQIIRIWDFSFSIYELIVASLHSMIFEIIVNWRIMRIEHNLEHLIHHICDELFRPFVWLSKIWIRIYLYKPNPKVLINHKIVAKELKWLLAMMRVDLALNSQEGIDDDILHPGYQVF